MPKSLEIRVDGKLIAGAYKTDETPLFQKCVEGLQLAAQLPPAEYESFRKRFAAVASIMNDLPEAGHSPAEVEKAQGIVEEVRHRLGNIPT